MADIKTQIEEKKAELEQLQATRKKGFCNSKVSSAEDVERETAIEDLEDEIERLRKQLQ